MRYTTVESVNPMLGLYLLNSATKEVFKIVSQIDQQNFLVLDVKNKTVDKNGFDTYGHYHIFSLDKLRMMTLISYEVYSEQYRKYYENEK